MAFPSVTYTFSNGVSSDAGQVNQNFTDVINGLSDGTKSLNISALTMAGTFTLNGSLGASVLPATTATYDLGSSTLGMRALYVAAGSGAFTVKINGGTMAASYTMTLPTAVPASTLPVVMSTAGALSTSTVTQAMRAALGQQVSSSSGTFSTSSTSYVDVTNLSVSLTTTGRPVFLAIVGDGTGPLQIGNFRAADIIDLYVTFLRDSTTVSEHMMTLEATKNSGLGQLMFYSGSALIAIDVPAAGTYTYKVQAKAPNGGSGSVAHGKLVAFEL